MEQAKIVQNFGRNLRFKPSHVYSPINKDELIDILEKHKRGKIRVVASKHSWSGLIETEGVLIDMSYFDYVKIQEKNHETSVTVGAGCKVKKLLADLNLK
jgi:FAD/FMN-containing dehydrogenase